MGESTRLDADAMREVAEHLDAAASNIVLIGLTWPEPDEALTDEAVDIHVESARLWVGSVVDRLRHWSERAQAISAALETRDRRGARRLN